MASLNWHDLFRKEDLNELCDCGIDVYSGNRLRQLIIEFARKQGDDVQVIVDSESLNYYAGHIACSIILARIENPDISLEQAACRPAVKELALSLINDYIAEHRFIKEGYALDAKKGWITVHPNGDDKKGQHILIDPDTGIVLGGAGGKFNGMHISQMCKHYPAPSATHKVVAQKAGNVSTKAAPSSGQSKAATNASYGTINGTTQHGVAPQSTPATSASGQSSGPGSETGTPGVSQSSPGETTAAGLAGASGTGQPATATRPVETGSTGTTASVETAAPAPAETTAAQTTAPTAAPPTAAPETAAPAETTAAQASSRKKGDCNGDGTVSILDVMLIRQHVLGQKQLSGDAAAAADVNGDGAITSADADALQSQILGG